MNKQIYELEDNLDTYVIRGNLPVLLTSANSIIDPTILSEKNENDITDDQIKNYLLEDIEVETVSMITIKRYRKIVEILKNKFNHKCQLCGFSFHMDNGDDYCEAHHIKELSKGGSQNPNNVIILCSNHHRQFHYARDRIAISELDDGKKIIQIDGQEYYIPANHN